VSLLERQRSPRQYVQFLIFNIQANRVAIVSSVITKIFKQLNGHNSASFERKSSNQSLYCFLPVLIVQVLFASVLLFASVFIRCSAFVRLDSFVECSNYSVYFLS
jgi:hypothetical protein